MRWLNFMASCSSPWQKRPKEPRAKRQNDAHQPVRLRTSRPPGYVHCLFQLLRRRDRRLDYLSLRPRLLVDVSQRSLCTTLLGRAVAMPLIVAPTALAGLAHPDSEIAIGRGDPGSVGSVASAGFVDPGFYSL